MFLLPFCYFGFVFVGLFYSLSSFALDYMTIFSIVFGFHFACSSEFLVCAYYEALCSSLCVDT